MANFTDRRARRGWRVLSIPLAALAAVLLASCAPTDQQADVESLSSAESPGPRDPVVEVDLDLLTDELVDELSADGSMSRSEAECVTDGMFDELGEATLVQMLEEEVSPPTEFEEAMFKMSLECLEPPTPSTEPPAPEPTIPPAPPAPPVTEYSPPPAPVAPQSSNCSPNYTGCVPIASDVDCAGGSGNGPAYVRGPVQVLGADIYGLDSDGDGVGCE